MGNAPSVVAAIRNRAAVDAVFGRWSSFHDCLVVAVRQSAEGPGAPALELDVLAPAGYERRGEYYHGIDHHHVTLRFHRATDVVVSDFGARNVIGELVLSAVEAAGGDATPRIRAELQPIPLDGGCELTLLCDEVEVVSVAPAA